MVRTKAVWLVPSALSCLLLALWFLPVLWYTEDSERNRAWFSEQTDVQGWVFESVPISQAAERLLVADETLNGEFRNPAGEAVRVFSAKRFKDSPNEIGLFVHTPDRCWVEGGWKIEPANSDVAEVVLHGIPVQMERRVFRFGSETELVYFCGLVNGRPLPYRLDHNLSMAARSSKNNSPGLIGGVSSTHFWKRLWTSFTSRKPLSGPKQFLRISTPVQGENVIAADERLQTFIPRWIRLNELQQEVANLSK